MPDILAAKSAKAKPKVTMKICPRCNTSKPITDFYINKEWEEQLGHDLWCKECFAKCQCKDDVREYFWNNNREFTESIWDTAKAKAERKAATNATFQKLNEDRREKILNKLACAEIPIVLSKNVKYVDNTVDGQILTYEEAKRQGKILATVDDDIREYSPEFNGDFKRRELEYLQDYYRGLENDFDLSDTNLRDIARKLAKASLQADKVQNDFSLGRCSMSDVKDALAQVDLLSKTGNFAACKKKSGDNNGLSWSEITLKLETTGHPCTRKIEWEPDDVDRTIAEFRYLTEALSLDTL